MNDSKKSARESFRLKPAQLLNILNSIAEGIYCVDSQGVCNYCNASCVKLLRYDSPDELLGQDMHALIHHTHRDGTPYPAGECKVLEAFSQDHEVHVDNEVFWRKDGSRFDVEYWSYPLKEDGKILGAVVSFLDVTLRREESAYRYHLAQLVESSNDAIIGKDPDGFITSWNSGATRIFGYDAEEVMGLTAAELILPPGYEQEEELVRQAIKHGQPLDQFDAKRRRKNGEICDVTISISPMFDSNGQYTGCSIVERDTTERRKSQDELMRAKTAAEHAETLANVANRSRAEFLAAVSHELRTPMNATLGMLQMALEEKGLDPRIRNYLKTAKSSADSLLDLVNEILDFSKIESGNFELSHAPFSIRDIVDKSAKTLSTRADEKNLEILCEIDSDIPDTLMGDGLRIQQILTNLLSNAVKFTESGEIVIRVRLRRKLPEEVRLQFAVSDTGIGIRPADQERIFSPFAQGDMSLTRQHHGTGLGLAICRELLALMGSTLRLESEYGKGSTFYFDLMLPIVETATSNQLPPRALVENLRVLVVDDNATNLRILEKILVNWAMQPVVAESTEQAIRILEESEEENQEISLAIVDATMPGIDGFTFADRVAERTRTGKTPVVIMESAAELAKHTDRPLKSTVANFLTKPVSQSELLNTVVDTLDLYEGEGAEAVEQSIQPLNGQPSLKVLVAEDMPANRQVVQVMLTKRGHEVLLAEDGQAAVKTIQKDPSAVDLVLMDIQMPRMDGFQATTAIRELPDSVTDELPIVAMTAHAMQGDREACLAAGMDAYISKPLDANQLIELVEAMVHDPESVESGDTHQTAGRLSSVKSESKHQGEVDSPGRRQFISDSDLELVDLTSAVNRLGGDQELFCEFVEIFMQDAPPLMEEIERAIEQEDHSRLEKSAHALKGLMANFGAQPCVDVALEFEQAGRKNRFDDVDGRLELLKQRYEKLRDELTPFVE